MVDPLIGFVSGIGVSLVGALLGNIFTRRRERRRLVEERQFQIYMKLMDLHTKYFWFTTAEFHKRQVEPEVRKSCRELAWQIADLLRSADEIGFLEKTLEVTLGPSFATATERYEAIGALLAEMGKQINPRYAKKIRQISEANIQLLASDKVSNAPGSTQI